MKKILSLLLVGIMVVSMIPTALATTNYTNGTQVQYNAEADNDNDGQPDHSEAWTVTVPALLEPGSEGNVVAQGTWASNRKLVVTADETVTLANNINANDTKTLDIGFDGIELAGSNTTAVSATEAVSVADIEDALFGTWSGTFYYDVEMVDNIQIANFAISYYSYENGQDTWTPKTYQFEQGMTWGEWINSPYNVDGFIKSNYGENVHDAANNNYVERIITQTEGGATQSEAVQISHVILDAGEYRVMGFPS